MISKQQVQHIAKLARISLTEKEVLKFQKDLSSILNYFEKLKEVKTDKVKPFFQSQKQILSLKEQILLREDKAEKSGPRMGEKLIAMAPDKEGRHIKVKPIFNGDK